MQVSITTDPQAGTMTITVTETDWEKTQQRSFYHGEQAVQQLTEELATVSKNSGPEASLHCLLGVAYAGLGDAPAAVSEGQKGIALQPTSEDPFEGPERQENMAQIYALLGNADEAIPILKRLLDTSSPTEITTELMRINPIWDPIRSDPRFQELVAEKKP